MTKGKLILLIILALAVGVGVAFIFPLNIINFRVLGLNDSRDSNITLTANYFAEKEFYEGIIDANNKKSEFNGDGIYGGVVPHHLLPGYILSDFFEKLSKQNPKRIILVGPNHHEAGGIAPITSSANWKTQFGELKSDYPVVRDLIDKKVLVENDEVMVNEHSIGGILHYIKYYVPDSTVVPIILSSMTKPEEVSALAQEIEKYVDADTVVIASVDFSHYLNSKEAAEKDVVTRGIIEEFDYENLYRLDNDYVDSPNSIGLLLNLMQKVNAIKPNILFNTNSGILFDNDTIQTTSYFSIVFTRN